jgi:hypothetical protein
MAEVVHVGTPLRSDGCQSHAGPLNPLNRMGEETSAEEKLRLKSRNGCQMQHTDPSPLSRPHLASLQLCSLSDYGWSLDEVSRILQAGWPPSDRNLSTGQPPWAWRQSFHSSETRGHQMRHRRMTGLPRSRASALWATHLIE